MNLDLLLLVAFGIVLLLVMLLNRKRVKVEKFLFPLFYIVMYRTSLGLKLMDKVAGKFPRTLRILGLVGIVVGFIGMALMFFNLISLSINIFSRPESATPSVRLLLPGTSIPGLPRLGFLHWIIAIFILATVHEFSHGVIARLYNIEVKSSGFAVFGMLLPILPAAFVEPDEVQAGKKSKKAQLSMLAAGSFSNFITAAVFFLVLILIMNPVTAYISESKGVKITGLEEGFPAKLAGVQTGELITSVSNIRVENVEGFVNVVNSIKPGESVLLETNKASYSIVAAQNPTNPEKSFLGLSLQPERVFRESITNKYGMFLPRAFLWLALLIQWIFMINLFVGLINLLPLFVTDGSRMAYLAALFFLRDERKTKRLWGLINMFSVFLLIANTSLFVNILKLLNA